MTTKNEKNEKKRSKNKSDCLLNEKSGISDSTSEYSTTMTLEDYERKNKYSTARQHKDSATEFKNKDSSNPEHNVCACGESDCSIAGSYASDIYEFVNNINSKSNENRSPGDNSLKKDAKFKKTIKVKPDSEESLKGKETRKRYMGSKEFINLHAIYSSRAYWTRATTALTELQHEGIERSMSVSSKSSMISKRDRLNTSLADNERNDNHPVEATMSGIENFVEYRSSFNSLFNSKDISSEMRLENLDRLRGLPTDPFVFLENANDVRFLNRVLKPFQLYVFMTEYMYGYYDMELGESNLSPRRIQLDEILWDTLAPLIPILCRQVVESILYKESVILQVSPPCIILGDIHGNLNDIWYIHQHFISNPEYAEYKFVFLGDYVDRGAKSVEVVVFLFLLKCIDPNRFVILRGNHEVSKINQKYGFKAVVKRIFGCSYLETPGVLCDLIYQSLNLAFDNLPLGCEIRKDKYDAGIFCCHGGIPNSQLREKEGPWLVDELNMLGAHGLKPHCLIPARNSTKQLLAMNEILWNDPMPDKIHHKKPNKIFHRNKKRGGHCSYFSQKAVEDFMNANNFFAIVRGHQFKQTKDCGYSFQFDQKVITVFSGSNYCGNERNSTGYCSVEANGDITANTLRTAEQTEAYRNLNRFLLEIDPKTKEPKYCIF